MDVKLKPIENQIERLESQMNKLEGEVSELASMLMRYIDSTEKIVSLESDVSILKKVVAEHSEKLQKIS